jgi:GNAT superfamily N-acetyltransferase
MMPPAPLSIRPASLEDRPALEDLRRRASLANPGDRPSLLAHPDALVLPAERISQGGVFVAELDQKLTGFAAILPREDEDAELDALFVDPLYWRRGVGRALIEQCVIEARRLGAQALRVIGNSHALEFYFACGFEIIGNTQTRFAPAAVLRKTLSTCNSSEVIPKSP